MQQHVLNLTVCSHWQRLTDTKTETNKKLLVRIVWRCSHCARHHCHLVLYSGGSRGTRRPTPPPPPRTHTRPKIFKILCIMEILAKSYVGAPWRVSALPTGNPGPAILSVYVGVSVSMNTPLNEMTAKNRFYTLCMTELVMFQSLLHVVLVQNDLRVRRCGSGLVVRTELR